MTEIPLGLVTAGIGFLGVMLGLWAAERKEQRQRRYDFRKRQLDEFYGPMCALRQELRATGMTKARISEAANAAWRGYFEGIAEPEVKRAIADRFSPALEKSIAYNNTQLETESIPAYRRMIALFQEKHGLIEPATRCHYTALVEFVEVWRRFLSGAILPDVPEKLGHGEERLHGLYEDIEAQRDRLRKILEEG